MADSNRELELLRKIEALVIERDQLSNAAAHLEIKLDNADRIVARLEGKIEALEDALSANRASIKEYRNA